MSEVRPPRAAKVTATNSLFSTNTRRQNAWNVDIDSDSDESFSDDDNMLSNVTDEESCENESDIDDSLIEFDEPPSTRRRISNERPPQTHATHPIYDSDSQWTSVTVSSDDVQRTALPPFDSSSRGLRILLPETPEDFALEILDEEFFQCLADWTNSRASKETFTNKTKSGQRSHTKQWENVTSDVMKKVFGMILVTGVLRKPELKDYFSTDPMIETPFFLRKDTLSRDHFLRILRYIRFADYQNLNNGKMARINPIIQLLVEKCRRVYLSKDKRSVDEFLLLHKGRVFNKQYIKSKRARFGIKVFSLNDQNGFTVDVEVYEGSKGNSNWATTVDGADQLSMSEKIVVEMLNRNGLLGDNGSVAIDNWFNSVRLARFLFEKGNHVLGTVRCCRGVPKALKDFKMDPPSVEFARNENIIIVKFTDKRDVYHLSTRHQASTVQVKRYTKGPFESELIHKPTQIVDYNFEMDGTDRADAMQHPVTIARKTFVWHRKLGLFISQRMGILNAFILSREYLPSQMKSKTFAKYCLDVARRLTAITESVRVISRRLENHNTEKIPSTSASRPRPTKRCAQCKRTRPNERAKDTRYQCSVCVQTNGDNIPLHLGECFDLWHKSA